MSLSDLVLGTVQLGAPYGIANRSGMPSEEEAIGLIHAAIEAGVTQIDTARGYGESETRIGKALKGKEFAGEIITKLRPPPGFSETTSLPEIKSFVRSDIDASRSALEMDRLDCVLLHRARHLIEWNGAIWQELLQLQQEGIIARLGVSTQTAEETIHTLETNGAEHIQLAANLLDWRWKNAHLDQKLRERKDITVHARSTFLQGLLVAGDASLFPVVSSLDAERTIQAINTLVDELSRSSAADLCLAYIRAQDWIDGTVLGMETQQQLEENIALFDNPPLTEEEIKKVENSMPHLPEKLLNPGLWAK